MYDCWDVEDKTPTIMTVCTGPTGWVDIKLNGCRGEQVVAVAVEGEGWQLCKVVEGRGARKIQRSDKNVGQSVRGPAQQASPSLLKKKKRYQP